MGMSAKRRRLYFSVSLGALGGLAACQSVPGAYIAADPLLEAEGRAAERRAAAADSSQDRQTQPPVEAATIGRETELFYGDERFFDPARGTPETGNRFEQSEVGEQFTFRNAPIDAVLNQVLGDTFGVSYSIAPGVSGSISLRLEGIANAEEAVAGLNAALQLQNIEITDTVGGYVVSRRGETRGELGEPVFISPDSEVPDGTSLAVLQIRYADLQDVTELARVMLPDGIIRHSDDARGLVVLEGDPGAVASGVELLKSLDVNWLSSVSTALIPIENADPAEIAADLEPLIGRTGGVSVVPIDRLATLMIVARNPESLDQVRTWVDRLDRDAEPKLTTDTLVYEARYVSADRLANIARSGVSNAYAPSPGGFSATPAIASDQQFGSSGFDSTRTDYNLTSNRSSPGLYSNIAVQVDPGRNAIIARGAQDELRSLRDLIELLDQPQRQVLIEATIVEVSLTENNQFGVQWSSIVENVEATFTELGSGAVNSLFPGVSVSYINADVDVVVNALAASSDSEVVSSPRMLVINNETARLQIGDQVPIITQSAVSIDDPGAPIVNQTTYRDTGVILSVTPSIRAGGMVEIEISQEVSGVAETTSSTIDSPTITQRSVESILAVPDGSTAILGGLMSSSRSFSDTGVPFLKDIPIAGALFRSRSAVERRTELVILIEPTVVHAMEPEFDMPARLREALLRARKLKV